MRTQSRLDLPPGFREVSLRESGDAYAEACRIAAEEGAGTLVWVRRFDLAEFAVILEPEEELRVARKAFFMGMNAVADAIAARCPPEREVTFDWPDAIRFDGGLVGGGRIGWPRSCGEAERPDWLVFAGAVRVAFVEITEPGEAPSAAALAEEGSDDIGPAMIVESFARFFLRQADLWQSGDFQRIAGDYLARLGGGRPGERRGLDVHGDLLVRPVIGETERRLALRPALDAAAWLDPATGGPRL
jgi:Biotin/lipoate A/B protein ligase family